MNAIIMAGGAGSRLRPLTCAMPKPMLPVAGKPVIERAVALLKKHGIHSIGVTLQYIPQMIKAHLDSLDDGDVAFSYFTETVPMGTAGSVKMAQEFLDDTFIVLSGDGLTDIDLSEAINSHREKGAHVTVVLKRVANPLEYGVVLTDGEGKITKFVEKPDWSQVCSDLVNTGIYIINKDVMDMLEKGVAADFSHDLFPEMLKRNMKLYGFVSDGYWCDIGNKRSYMQANADALAGLVSIIDLKSEFNELSEGIFMGKNVKIDDSAVLHPPCLICDNSTVKGNAVIHPNTIIGKNCFVNEYATLKSTVLHDNVTVGASAELRGAVICSDTKIDDNVCIFEDCTVGNGCIVERGCIISNGASVWPEKKILSDCCVSENVIHQSECSAGLFSDERVSGKIGMTVTPQFTSKLVSCFCADKSSKQITVAHDGSVAAKMLILSATASAVSQGCKVLELGCVALPAVRHTVRIFSVSGGIYIGTKNDVAEIFFLDEKGANISSKAERALESTMNFSKNEPASLSKMHSPQAFEKCAEYYEKHIVSLMNDMRIPEDLRLRIISNAHVGTQGLIRILERLNIPHSVSDKFTFDGEDSKCITAELDKYGETLVLYNEKGERVARDVMNLLLNYISLKRADSKKYTVAPYSAPDAVDIIAHDENGTVIRTSSRTSAVINEIVKHDAIHDSLPIGKMSMYYDGVMFLLELVSLSATEKKNIHDIISSLPEIHISSKEAECEWEKRSAVLHRLIGTRGRVPSGEGIKITHKYGWSLIVPDNRRAVFKIYSEGFSEEYAEELSDIYVRKINEFRNMDE